jgi:hypothetical protein
MKCEMKKYMSNWESFGFTPATELFDGMNSAQQKTQLTVAYKNADRILQQAKSTGDKNQKKALLKQALAGFLDVSDKYKVAGKGVKQAVLGAVAGGAVSALVAGVVTRDKNKGKSGEGEKSTDYVYTPNSPNKPAPPKPAQAVKEPEKPAAQAAAPAPEPQTASAAPKEPEKPTEKPEAADPPAGYGGQYGGQAIPMGGTTARGNKVSSSGVVTGQATAPKTGNLTKSQKTRLRDAKDKIELAQKKIEDPNASDEEKAKAKKAVRYYDQLITGLNAQKTKSDFARAAYEAKQFLETLRDEYSPATEEVSRGGKIGIAAGAGAVAGAGIGLGINKARVETTVKLLAQKVKECQVLLAALGDSASESVLIAAEYARMILAS